MSFVVIITHGIQKRNSSNTGWVKRSMLLSQTGAIIQYSPKVPLDQVLQHQDTRILLDLFIQREENGKHHSNVKVIDKTNDYNEITILSSEKSLNLRFPSDEIKNRWLQAFRYCLVQLNKHFAENNEKVASNLLNPSALLSIPQQAQQPQRQSTKYQPLLSTRNRDGLSSVRQSTLITKRIETKTPRQKQPHNYERRSSTGTLLPPDHEYDDLDEDEIQEEDGLTQFIDQHQNNKKNNISLNGGNTVEFTTIHEQNDEIDANYQDPGLKPNHIPNNFSSTISVRSVSHYTDADGNYQSAVAKNEQSNNAIKRRSSLPTSHSVNSYSFPIPNNDGADNSYPRMISTPQLTTTPNVQQPNNVEEEVEPTFVQRYKKNLILATIYLLLLTTISTLLFYNGSFYFSNKFKAQHYPLESYLYTNNPYITPINKHSIQISFPLTITLPFTSTIEGLSQTIDMSTEPQQVLSIQKLTAISTKHYQPLLSQSQQPSKGDIPPVSSIYNQLITDLNQSYKEYEKLSRSMKKLASTDVKSTLDQLIDKQQSLFQYIKIKEHLDFTVHKFKPNSEFISKLQQLSTPIQIIDELQQQFNNIEDKIDIITDDINSQQQASIYILNESIDYDDLASLLSLYYIKHHINPTTNTINHQNIQLDYGELMMNKYKTQLKSVSNEQQEKMMKLLTDFDINLFDIEYSQLYYNEIKPIIDQQQRKNNNHRQNQDRKGREWNKSIFYKIAHAKQFWLNQQLELVENVSYNHQDDSINQHHYQSLPKIYNTPELKSISQPTTTSQPLSNEVFMTKLNEYQFISHIINAYNGQKLHYSNLSSTGSKSTQSSILSHLHHYYIYHHQFYVFATFIITTVVLVLIFLGLRYQELLADKITSDLPLQFTLAISLLALLTIGSYLFSIPLLITALINVLVWVGAVILTQIDMFFELMDLLMIEEEPQRFYPTSNDTHIDDDLTDYNIPQQHQHDKPIQDPINVGGDDEEDGSQAKTKSVKKSKLVSGCAKNEVESDSSGESDDEIESPRIHKKTKTKNQLKVCQTIPTIKLNNALIQSQQNPN
jgi:hypothetical protein